MYSQGEEQKHILAAVGESGRFLDIGAFHSHNLSNTRALYERGWSGVMIEPSPEPFLGLLKEYGTDERITLILGAVGLKDGLVPFHVSSDALTTSSERNYDIWRAVGGFYGKFFCPMIPVETVRGLGDFDFVSIDTEGTSVEVFASLLELGTLPGCICVEHDGAEGTCRTVAKSYGYRELYYSGENLVFAR